MKPISIDATVNDAGPLSGAAAASDPRARQEAHRLAEQFEAMLLTQMLRDMRRSMLSSDEGEDATLGSNALSDTIDVELGLALTRSGGIGLASSLSGAFERF